MYNFRTHKYANLKLKILYDNSMCRVVSFLSAKGGVGKSSIICSLAKELSYKNFKVCVIDAYFGMNSLSSKFEKNNGIDLKEYITGNLRASETLNHYNDRLSYVKTNQVTFDYLSHIELIKFFVMELVSQFDYILVDVNCFNDKITSAMLDVSNEAIIVLNDHSDTIRNSIKLIQKVYLFSGIKNVNLILNQARVALEMSGKTLGEHEIKDILKQEILFVIPWLYKDNFLSNNFSYIDNRKYSKKLCLSFINNSREYVDYAKSYRGVFGAVRRKFYEKFE